MKKFKKGMLCWFSDFENQIDNEKSTQRILDIFEKTNTEGNNFNIVYETKTSFYKYCKPVEKRQIEDFLAILSNT